MTISKEQCIELAAKGLLDLDDWIKLTGIGPDHYPKPPEDYKICSKGIFPIGFEYDREADNKDEAKYKAMIDAHRQLAKSEGRFGFGEIELTQKLREIHKSLEQTPYINGGLAFADSSLNQTGKASIAAPKLSAELHENLSNEEFKLLADVLENSSTDESFQELCKFENSPPLNFPCTPWRLIDFVDSDIWGIFDVPDFFREAVASQNLVDWYNNSKSLSASMWFGLQSAAPREAAMLLCQFNPQDDRLDPLEISNPETGPADYKRLLRVFEDESHQHTLMQWIAIARDKGLKYHSWIDEYVNVAMPAPIDGDQPPLLEAPDGAEQHAPGAILDLPESAPPPESPAISSEKQDKKTNKRNRVPPMLALIKSFVADGISPNIADFWLHASSKRGTEGFTVKTVGNSSLTTTEDKSFTKTQIDAALKRYRKTHKYV